MIGLDNTYDALAWGSHLPALLACVGASHRQWILELGIGHFSTPALHALCGALNKKLISVEEDPKWRDEFSPKFSSPWHDFYCKSYQDALDSLRMDQFTFGTVLIDNSPGGNRRLDDFKAVLPFSEFVVVHDYHLENEDAIGPLLNGLNHHITKTYGPPTLVASDLRSIPVSILCL